MAKIKIDSKLFDRLKKTTELAGYSSVEEFITHIIEKALAEHEATEETDDKIADHLRGLGYID